MQIKNKKVFNKKKRSTISVFSSEETNKHIIEGGKCYTLLHLPKSKEPIIMANVRYMQVSDQNTIKFYGANNKCHTVSNIVDAYKLVKVIIRGIEASKNNVVLFEKNFYDPSKTYRVPAIADIISDADEDKKYPAFKNLVGLLKKEWDELKKGNIPVRLHSDVFTLACSKVFGKPLDCPLSKECYWERIIFNEETSRTDEVV